MLSLVDVTGHDSIRIEGMAFEGPLIKREVVEKNWITQQGFVSSLRRQRLQLPDCAGRLSGEASAWRNTEQGKVLCR